MSGRIKFWLCVGLAALVAGCGKPASEKPDVILLHTGRLRGNVVPVGLPAPIQYFPLLAGYVKQVRTEAARNGAEVILVDLGDSLGGSFAAHVTGSANIVAFFNKLGYDVVALSNLDNHITQEVLQKLKARVINPFIGRDGKPATPGTELSAVVEKGGKRVVVVPNFYGDTSQQEFPDRFPAIFGEGGGVVTPLRDYAEVAKETGLSEPGTLGVLTWMKFEDTAKQPVEFLANLSGLGVDVIVAHRIYGAKERDAWAPTGFVDWKPPVSLNILRNNGGFTISRMDLRRDGDGWRVLRHELVPMTSNTAPYDSEVVELIAQFEPAIREADRRLAELPTAVDEGQILAGYLRSLTGLPGVSAVITSRQSVRSDWPAGELRASEVFHAMPWTTPLLGVRLSRAELDGVAEKLDLNGLIQADANPDELLVAMPEFFAVLVKNLLRRPDLAVEVLAASEFDYFVGKLADERAFSTVVPEGWQPLVFSGR